MTSRLTRAHMPAVSPPRRWVWGAAVALLASTIGAPTTAVAQQPANAGVRRLSLDDALRLAEAQSEAVDIARAGVQRATGQRLQTRSQYLPQINSTAGYTKTLRSQFSGLSLS